MSASDFEDCPEPARRPVRVRDVGVAEIPRDADRRISESDMNADKQVFYFSNKLFDLLNRKLDRYDPIAIAVVKKYPAKRRCNHCAKSKLPQRFWRTFTG